MLTDRPVSAPGMIYLTETLNGIQLTIGAEWPSAGLYWQWDTLYWSPLGHWSIRSSGRFYPDQHGEILHGRTLADVVQTARYCAFRWLHNA